MGSYTELLVWQRAHGLTLGVYRATRTFPGDERFGLVTQLRRAVISVESNIAEGCGRGRDGELRRFLGIARGSVQEVGCQLLIARDLGLLDVGVWAGLDRDTREISRMLRALRDSLRP